MMGRVIVGTACATSTGGDCSALGRDERADTEAVKDVLWGTERDGGTVSEMEGKGGTIYRVAAVWGVGA